MTDRKDVAEVRLRVDAKTIWKVGFHASLVVVAVFVLMRLGAVLAWLLLALTLALALDPVVRWLERHRLPRGVAVLSVVLAFFGFVTALVVTLVPMLVEQARSLVESAPALMDRLRHTPFFQANGSEASLVDRARNQLASHVGSAAGSIVSVVGSVFTGIVGAITVLTMTIFMLLTGRPLAEAAMKWVEPVKRPRVAELARGIRRAVGGYVVGSIVVASIGGLVTIVTLLALGVPYFLPLGLAMALLGLVPFIGPTIGGVLIVGTTFLTVGMTKGLVSLGVFLGYQQLENQFLSPIVQRRTIRMNPLLIVLALVAGTSYAGILGAFLALPVAAAASVALRDALVRRRSAWGETDEPPAPTAVELPAAPAEAR